MVLIVTREMEIQSDFFRKKMQIAAALLLIDRDKLDIFALITCDMFIL